MAEPEIKRKSRVFTAGVALTLAAFAVNGSIVSAGAVPEQGRSPVPAAGPHWLTGDLTIRHQRVGADGRPAGPAVPAMVLRLDRRREGARWKTALSLRQSDPVWIQSVTGRQSLDNPFTIVRFEYDEDGTMPRMYDRKGRLVPGPTDADRKILGLPEHLRDRSWNPAPVLANLPSTPAISGDQGPAAGLLVVSSDRNARRLDVERRFGPAAGTVRGLDRFLVRADRVVHELLLNPDTALPVEVNLARDGQLVSRATFDYQQLPGGGFIRRHLRAEHAVADASGNRLISDVELTDLTFGEGSGR